VYISEFLMRYGDDDEVRMTILENNLFFLPAIIAVLLLSSNVAVAQKMPSVDPSRVYQQIAPLETPKPPKGARVARGFASGFCSPQSGASCGVDFRMRAPGHLP
jgi:hypothetical protein